MSASVYVPPITVRELREIFRLTDEILTLVHETYVAQAAGLTDRAHQTASMAQQKSRHLVALTKRLRLLRPRMPNRPAFTRHLRKVA